MEIYRGLVLAERSAGERGKFIDVLTEHNTVREIYVLSLIHISEPTRRS